MKIFIPLLIILLSGLLTVAQDFEGKVIYQNQYKSKMPGVTDEQLNIMMGTKQEYIVKGGDYKNIANGTFFQWQLYVNKDNKLYMKTAVAPVIYWNDAAENKDEIRETDFRSGAVEILGYTCDELVLTCKTGVQKYYFNSALKVDPKLYEKHQFGNWSAVMSKTKAIPLKIYIDNEKFIVEATAVEVVPMKIDGKELVLPEGSQLQKSPF